MIYACTLHNFANKRYINGIAAQKFDYNIINKHVKNKYHRTIHKNNRSHEYGY